MESQLIRGVGMTHLGGSVADVGADVADAAEPQAGLLRGVEGEERPTETRICRLIEPLKERRRILLASKEMHQVSQDLEDEIVSFWGAFPQTPTLEIGLHFIFLIYKNTYIFFFRTHPRSHHIFHKNKNPNKTT